MNHKRKVDILKYYFQCDICLRYLCSQDSLENHTCVSIKSFICKFCKEDQVDL